MLEGFSAISCLAAVTKRIKVGLLVAGNVHRHPEILVKTVRTLDVLSYEIHRGMSMRPRTKTIIKKVYL